MNLSLESIFFIKVCKISYHSKIIEQVNSAIISWAKVVQQIDIDLLIEQGIVQQVR